MNLINSPYEANVRDLLKTLSPEDIRCLAQTSTGNHRLSPKSSQEALNIILYYTSDLKRLFSYRRLTAQNLFNYLYKNQVPSMPFAKKMELVIAVKEFWTKQHGKIGIGYSTEQGRAHSNPQTEITSAIQLSIPGNTNIILCSNPSFIQYTTGETKNIIKNPKQCSFMGTAERTNLGTVQCQCDSYISTLLQHQTEESEIKTFTQTNNEKKQPVLCDDVPKTSIRTNNEKNKFVCGVLSPVEHKMEVIRSDEFIQKFCKWYFRMINRLQPECFHLPGDTFRGDIFYDNSYTDIYLIGQSNSERHAFGGGNTFQLLKQTFQEYKIQFSPNLENGIQAYQSNFGMVKISCCGTIHIRNSCVGIFEQETGMVCSPNNHVWKIMYIKINLKHASTHKPPSLPSCQVFEIKI